MIVGISTCGQETASQLSLLRESSTPRDDFHPRELLLREESVTPGSNSAHFHFKQPRWPDEIKNMVHHDGLAVTCYVTFGSTMQFLVEITAMAYMTTVY